MSILDVLCGNGFIIDGTRINQIHFQYVGSFDRQAHDFFVPLAVSSHVESFSYDQVFTRVSVDSTPTDTQFTEPQSGCCGNLNIQKTINLTGFGTASQTQTNNSGVNICTSSAKPNIIIGFSLERKGTTGLWEILFSGVSAMNYTCSPYGTCATQMPNMQIHQTLITDASILGTYTLNFNSSGACTFGTGTLTYSETLTVTLS
jgi:hypothetical protein